MKKKILAICLALTLVLCTLPLAGFAATAAKVKMPNEGGSLNLRSGPGTNYSSVGYVQDGDSIQVYAENGEWSSITVDRTGKSGYIKTKYISTNASASTTAYVYVSADGGSLKVRAGAGTNYGVNGYVQHGDAIMVLSKGDVWSQIKVNKNGVTGYIKTKYIRSNPPSTAGSGPIWDVPSTSAPTTYDAAVIMTKTVGGQVNLRSGAGTNYQSLGKLSRGTFLKVTGTSGDWRKVTLNNGTSGYVQKNYVSFGVKGVTTGNVNLRTGAGTNHSVKVVLSKGTSITVHSISGNWAKVTAGSNTGYISIKYFEYN